VKGRQAPKHGERNGRAKLSEKLRDDVVREYAAGGVSYDKLAKKYGVSKTAIANLLRGKSWQHREPPRGIVAIKTRNYSEKGLRGSKNPSSKLSAESVRAIRADYAIGAATARELAERFGVNRSCIYKIVSGESWKHI
jgi:transposase